MRRRATHDSLERAIEVGHGLKSTCEGSFANSRVRIKQERLRFLHSDSRKVIDEIHAGRFLEHLAKVMPADVSRVRYPTERQWLRLMVLDELPRSRHICRFILFAPYGPVDLTRPKGAAQKCLIAVASRDIVSAIKRTTENKPAQAASNPSCSPTRGAAE